MPTPDQRPGRTPFALLQRLKWFQAREPQPINIMEPSTWCGDAQIAETIATKGYMLVNEFFAERYKQSSMLVLQRKLTPRILRARETDEQAYAVVNPQVASIRLLSEEQMKDRRTVRQQQTEGYQSLGIDTENRHIYVRTKTSEERSEKE
jgi:hypothetical protein